MKHLVALVGAAAALVIPTLVEMPVAHAEGAIPAPMCAVVNPVTNQIEKTPGAPVATALCQDRLEEPSE